MEKAFEPLPPKVEKTAKAVIDAAFRVHSKLGPGLLESVYETCICYELSKAGVPFESQVALPITYDEVKLDAGMRLDILADKCVIIELKSVEKVSKLFDAQVLTYLKLARLRLGLLINFNVPLIADGIKRIIL